MQQYSVINFLSLFRVLQQSVLFLTWTEIEVAGQFNINIKGRKYNLYLIAIQLHDFFHYLLSQVLIALSCAVLYTVVLLYTDT